FDTVKAKADAIPILRDDLARKVRPAFIGMGAMSDPYNPFERELCLTGHALDLIDAYQCGVAVATKSDLIVRDTERYRSIQSHSPVICKITITTLDDRLAAKVEPGAPSPSRRLAAVEQLAKAGIFTGVLLMPVLPFLEDSEKNVAAVAAAAAGAGAAFVYAAFGVTLRDGQREYFYRALERAFPGQELAKRYAAKYGMRYQCSSPKAGQLWKVFSQECRSAGLLCEMRHIISAATRPYADRQLTCFD
ncbi:MAG: radical SAM protein, partial [Lawsonibacter sp.]